MFVADKGMEMNLILVLLFRKRKIEAFVQVQYKRRIYIYIYFFFTQTHTHEIFLCLKQSIQHRTPKLCVNMFLYYMKLPISVFVV